ncbi:MAG: hypothetical protein M0Z55_11360 [Peptococcaceae bacterium]|nr:hypothetical protein [Peptococcaceae bacterium]
MNTALNGFITVVLIIFLILVCTYMGYIPIPGVGLTVPSNLAPISLNPASIISTGTVSVVPNTLQPAPRSIADFVSQAERAYWTVVDTAGTNSSVTQSGQNYGLSPAPFDSVANIKAYFQTFWAAPITANMLKALHPTTIWGQTYIPLNGSANVDVYVDKVYIVSQKGKTITVDSEVYNGIQHTLVQWTLLNQGSSYQITGRQGALFSQYY